MQEPFALLHKLPRDAAAGVVEHREVEPVGGDWQILSSSHAYTQTDAWTFTMSPDVPANGETTVRYRVRVRWC